MRLLIILALLVVVVLVVLLLYSAIGRVRDDLEPRWETHTESSGGVTTVIVRQVTRDPSGALVTELGRQAIATIPDSDPDWETRYHEAMAQARSRVATLEIEAG